MELKDTGYCKIKREVQSPPNNLLLFRQRANISQDKLAEAVDCRHKKDIKISPNVLIITIYLPNESKLFIPTT